MRRGSLCLDEGYHPWPHGSNGKRGQSHGIGMVVNPATIVLAAPSNGHIPTSEDISLKGKCPRSNRGRGKRDDGVRPQSITEERVVERAAGGRKRRRYGLPDMLPGRHARQASKRPPPSSPPNSGDRDPATSSTSWTRVPYTPRSMQGRVKKRRGPQWAYSEHVCMSLNYRSGGGTTVLLQGQMSGRSSDAVVPRAAGTGASIERARILIYDKKAGVAVSGSEHNIRFHRDQACNLAVGSFGAITPHGPFERRSEDGTIGPESGIVILHGSSLREEPLQHIGGPKREVR